MEKYRVVLEVEGRAGLEHLIAAGKAASRRLAHARILLLADAGGDDEEIVAALATSLRTVARVRERFVTEGIDSALDPRPRPRRPDKIKIKGDVEQRLIQLACTDPPRGRCHWTLRLLANEMVVLGLVDSISTETAFRDTKEVVGAGQQQVRFVWASIGAVHLCLWTFTMTEARAWARSEEELVDRAESPWDDPARRPSHADERRAWRRGLLAQEIPDRPLGPSPNRIRAGCTRWA